VDSVVAKIWQESSDINDFSKTADLINLAESSDWHIHATTPPLEERLFLLLAASNLSATAYFRIPPDQVVELGLQLEI
jgi:K+ transporter